MLNKKPLLGLAAMSIFVAHTASADPELPDNPSLNPTSGEVIFSGSVESQCGVNTLKDSANLTFGEDYGSSHAQVHIINNSNKDVKIFATNVDISSFGDQIEDKDVHIKTTGVLEKDKDLGHWEDRGESISREDIVADPIMNLYARVDETDLDADINYEVRTTWTIECN